ncbi:hypothetical protein PILCRDRAFT_551559 [Piloderma croceum F 1598]|uniref:Uncharacterized protein n=1 Tax=Piloderma croceum (strain F 1598) TaxID=765440 RepID=A0A0C3BQU1_PILCF|nr:hypothetical protein PILCRDRAFT_551559 [Piloderma croceum F 1598]
MAVETRRIDHLIAAELSLTCGARALRERSAFLRCACLLVAFLLEAYGSGSRDDDNENATWTYSGVNCLARNSSGKNECDSSRNSNELQISHVSILSKDSDGICKIYSPSLLMMVDFESLKYGGYVVLLC